jgi:hypothetical protein
MLVELFALIIPALAAFASLAAFFLASAHHQKLIN